MPTSIVNLLIKKVDKLSEDMAGLHAKLAVLEAKVGLMTKVGYAVGGAIATEAVGALAKMLLKG